MRLYGQDGGHAQIAGQAKASLGVGTDDSHTFHRRMQHFVGELLANCMASTPGTLTPAVAAVRPKLRDQGPPAQIQAAANGEMDGAGVRGRNPRGRERGLRGKW